ncbi:HD domain-containing protein [Desulfovibrio inopinatus]|uniref:HD domain-containing protein n=1 Tax=Desulfovibrio inopinatus TaxID=102109 RepID=UPI00041BF232|nr:HD domain-containing protein [Desulfovibrio inopinatus]
MSESNKEDWVYNLLDFLRRAEALKSTLRTTWTQSGRQESTAEHSWRLCLFAMLISKAYPDLDALKILQLCIVHDLGEAIHGDIPAPEQTGPKDEQEREDLKDLVRPLPEEQRHELLCLWEEYEYAQSPEARLVKALDKLETLLQHVQGTNPSRSVDYIFNLGYGVRYTELDEFIKELRSAVDRETECCLHSRSCQGD